MIPDTGFRATKAMLRKWTTELHSLAMTFEAMSHQAKIPAVKKQYLEQAKMYYAANCCMKSAVARMG